MANALQASVHLEGVDGGLEVGSIRLAIAENCVRRLLACHHAMHSVNGILDRMFGQISQADLRRLLQQKTNSLHCRSPVQESVALAVMLELFVKRVDETFDAVCVV